VADNDRVRAAADQLYAADPADFTDRRGDLVAQARAGGDKDAARAIAALRRPTRAAWVVNRLARTDPRAVARLTGLGDELRAAESALDGGQLRELSRARRELLAELTRQALAEAGVGDPPDALEQEVSGTLGAALADPGVAAEVAAAQLVKAVAPGGFGFGPALAGADAEPSTGSGTQPRPEPKSASSPPPRVSRRKADEKQRAAERERADRERAERARAELERQREAISQAEQTLAEADRTVDAAHAAEEDRESTVRRLETQLEDAQDALADAKRRSREARTAQRQARKALERLRDRASQLHVTAGYRAGLDHGRLADPDGRARAPRR
jgi:DNA repair exonuclease SbcCD ATPase subunit